MIFSKPVFQLWPEVPDKTPGLAKQRHQPERRWCGPQSVCSVPKSYQSPLAVRCPRSTSTSLYSSSQYPLCRGCTDHMTRACRTLQALQLPPSRQSPSKLRHKPPWG